MRTHTRRLSGGTMASRKGLFCSLSTLVVVVFPSLAPFLEMLLLYANPSEQNGGLGGIGGGVQPTA